MAEALSMQSDQINEIAKALAAAQTELTNPQKTKTAKAGSYTYKYADIADVLDCVRPVLAKHGISVSQPTIMDSGVLIVQTRLSHSTGQWMASDYPVCSINGDHQKMGAALTYARRYALTSMIGVAAEDDGDGQNAAKAEAPQKVLNPKTGRMVNPRSSNQAKERGDWQAFQADLQDCASVVRLNALHEEYRTNIYPGWSASYRESAEEEFEKRQAELTADDPRGTLEASVAQTRAEYIQWSHDKIAGDWKDSAELLTWWKDEMPARRRFSLSQAEADDLKDRTVERREELDAKAKAGEPMPLEAG